MPRLFNLYWEERLEGLPHHNSKIVTLVSRRYFAIRYFCGILKNKAESIKNVITLKLCGLGRDNKATPE